jgi:uncharacterized DUF497 family protein
MCRIRMERGKRKKNWAKHRVTGAECEEVFFSAPLLASIDLKHSKRKSRYFALGQTDTGRPTFMAFTIRGTRIRVISARDMTRREMRQYGI